MFSMVLDLKLIKIGNLGRFPFFMPGSGKLKQQDNFCLA